MGRGKPLTVLVTDDEMSVRVLLETLLSELGYSVSTASDLAGGLAAFEATEFDLVITDKNLPDGSGIELAQRVLDRGNECGIIIMSAFASLDSAVEAIRMGVADYLVKPFEDIDEVSERLERVVKRIRLQQENEDLVRELRRTNERLEELVARDSLTGLFNHAYFQERLEAEIRRSERHEHRFGLVFFDVDYFKDINDTLGHQAGDEVLKEVAAILRGNSRASDQSFRLREHDLAARYGGDEFVLILPETPKTGTTAKAERLRAQMRSCEFDKGSRVTLSVGVAAYPDDGLGRDALIQAADTALYAAKRLGRNRVVSYSASLAPPDAPGPRVAMPAEELLALERSIKGELFDTVYQPVVDVQSQAVYGYEAFGRPTDPFFGDIVGVLATAERAGQVVELGRLLRRKALAPMGRLATGACLFVNLHPHELYDPSLLLDDSPFAPFRERIVLELNQIGSITDHSRLQELLRNLRARGFRIALDNLPATYAGLNALTQVTAEFVKLDRSLLRGIQDDVRRARLLQHLLELAKDEKMLVVAEGIETREQFETCVELGFRLMQGFFFGPGEPPFAEVSLPDWGTSEPSSHGRPAPSSR